MSSSSSSSPPGPTREEKQHDLVLQVIRNILSRQSNIQDPAIRHAMFVDKLCLVLDVSMGFMESSMMESKDPMLLRKTQETMETVRSHLKDLFDWLQTPVYSPDHPFGNSIMKSCEKDFTSKHK